jgi:formylglycine-generating enzyme required for sulfatase activity
MTEQAIRFQPSVEEVQAQVAKKLRGLANCDKIAVEISTDGFGIRRVDTVTGPYGTAEFSFRLICPDPKKKNSWFWVQETQVTQQQWQAITGYNPSSFTGNDQRPVEQVSFDDIREKFLPFFEMTEEEKATVPQSAKGGRELWMYGYTLPTETQWEQAAQFEDENIPLELRCWHYENSGSTTHPVATLAPNKAGLYDMLGNVWEWTQTRTQ